MTYGDCQGFSAGTVCEWGNGWGGVARASVGVMRGGAGIKRSHFNVGLLVSFSTWPDARLVFFKEGHTPREAFSAGDCGS